VVKAFSILAFIVFIVYIYLHLTSLKNTYEHSKSGDYVGTTSSGVIQKTNRKRWSEKWQSGKAQNILG
jgi:hypothetical protein